MKQNMKLKRGRTQRIEKRVLLWFIFYVHHLLYLCIMNLDV